jgi:hypothetical protein
MLIDATGTSEEGEVNQTVASVLMHDHELSTGM